ncbi:MAG TPA: hypothetical protein VLA53_00330 [Nitrosopumilaceae archaeon]|nr:hypothetical protein [Nitrosopumilaceae archaeon]
MKAARPIIGLGIIVIISGIVFYLQGQSMVGPESSFMYSNPEWITNGQWIAIVGIIILAAGVAISKVNLQHPK